MHWNSNLLPAAEALNSIRRDFERAVGSNRRSDAGMSGYESPSEFLVVLDVPGVKVEDIEITLHDDILTIEGKREMSVPEGYTEVFGDRNVSEFKRTLRLREAVNRDQIDAEIKDGVLTVRLPRAAEKQPAKISVRQGS
ncbi:MAG: Hsp20/alpha crystallin family protein [Planctomycetaceae bacterium]|nr:Hsp20/alpha crystallin family protein [Planctomycetaceae bacterium]